MVKSKMTWKREQERRRRERQRRDRRRAICAIVVVLLAVIVVVILFAARGCTGKKTANSSAVNNKEAVTTETPAVEQYRSSISIDDVNTSFFKDSAFLGNSVADTISMYDLLQNTDFYSSPILTVDNVYTTIVGYGNTAAADQLKSKKFSKVFLSFGEREIASGDATEFARSYKSLVEKVRSYQTNAQIYLIGIPPIDKAASDESRYGMTLDTIKSYNKKIRSIASDLKVYYINSLSALGGSYLYNGVSADGINLNRDCCIELLKYITDNAYIPNAEKPDQASDEKEKSTQKPVNDDEDDEEGSTNSSSDNSEPTASPVPTVNVFKDSAKVKNGD